MECKCKKLVLATVALALFGSLSVAGGKEQFDSWHGFDRKVFDFHGSEAWIVKPKLEAKGRPWVWIMEWPDAFVKRNGSIALLKAGYHVVTLRPGRYENGKFVSKPGNMNDRRLRESRMFQKHLVEELRFAPKANLIGMSWGGFYSVRYAGTYPDAVSRIYLDAPLLDFSTLASKERWGLDETYGVQVKTYVGQDDPRQPVNMYGAVAKAGIPVLLLYGGEDAEVPPAKNALRFAKAFKAAGGTIDIVARKYYGHHPHGLEVDEQQIFVDFFRKARPVPAKNLLERMRSGVDVIGIVHFGINTFTDREWGYGSESPSEFNPTDFSADQIVKSCRDGGLKGLVVVAKHHDGFCLWPTKTTEHNITKTPFWRGQGLSVRGQGRDYVKEMERACRKYGLKFGVYCSPWDRNNAAYGRPEYVKTFHAQVEELNDGRYGEIFEMWFDGANGGDGYYGGSWEKRSIGVARKYYRMAKLWARVRELQPSVCFFGGIDGFIWPGNERGEVPPESGGTRDNGTFQIYEADFPLRPGWFYHASQDGYSRSGEFLMKIYLRTVGNGATMDVGISPDRRGRLTDEDAGCLRRFEEIRKAFFSKPVKSAATPFNVIVMTEDIERGERVDGWRVVLDGRELAKGGKIGTKRIRVLGKPVSGKNLRLEVLKGDAKPDEIKVELFKADEELVRKVMSSEAPKRAPAPFELKGVPTSRKQGELVYMMKHPRKISSLVLTPDSGSLDGTPVAFRIAYSGDGNRWTDDETVYRLDNVAANPVPQTVSLSKAANMKYLKIIVIRTLNEGVAAGLGGVEFVPAHSLAVSANVSAPKTENPHVRGRIPESGKYESLHPRFPKAFEFMRRPDLPSLPVGIYEIDGTNCWAIIMDATLRPFAATNQYEVHKAFIDIQSPISGPETIGVVESNPSMFGNFNYEKDFALFNFGGKPWNLVPGEFAVFFPDKGAHAPGLSVGSTNAIRKLVIKVRK